ncbi:MAG TPA: hypothetical protein VIB39_21230 [Candidatus Angelobacter sp.]|jgi:hypothetical protein
MKSYWIAAAAVGFLAWPFGSKAYAAGAGPAQAKEPPAQQSQLSSSTTPKDSTKTQTAPANATTTSAQNKNSYLLIELSKTLKASKLKPGDKVKAEVSQDVVSHGKVIIPVETELIGHVTEVGVRSAENPESRLGFVFDRILLKHYHDVNLRAVVQAVSPPVQRRSRVDEPSQMLPPSMVVGDLRQGSSPAMQGGRASSANNRSSNATSSQPTSYGSSSSDPTLQAPVTVKQSPSTNANVGSSAAQLSTSKASGSSMSVGMPQGVTGLKGLSLTQGATADTPGPVVISHVDNVKLEAGTQILLRVVSVETPQTPAKK